MKDNKHNYDEIVKYPGSKSQVIYTYSTSVYNDNTISLIMTTEKYIK